MTVGRSEHGMGVKSLNLEIFKKRPSLKVLVTWISLEARLNLVTVGLTSLSAFEVFPRVKAWNSNSAISSLSSLPRFLITTKKNSVWIVQMPKELNRKRGSGKLI